MVWNLWLALFELANHNTTSCITLQILALWLVKSNYASHGLRTLGPMSIKIIFWAFEHIIKLNFTSLCIEIYFCGNSVRFAACFDLLQITPWKRLTKNPMEAKMLPSPRLQQRQQLVTHGSSLVYSSTSSNTISSSSKLFDAWPWCARSSSFVFIIRFTKITINY